MMSGHRTKLLAGLTGLMAALKAIWPELAGEFDNLYNAALVIGSALTAIFMRLGIQKAEDAALDSALLDRDLDWADED